MQWQCWVKALGRRKNHWLGGYRDASNYITYSCVMDAAVGVVE